jgi:hypothetical protein
LKKGYITACLAYASVPDRMLDIDVYRIDMKFVCEEYDLLYRFSLALIGEKSYIGFNSYSFEDCLINLFNQGIMLSAKTIIFLNTEFVQKNGMTELYELYIFSLKKFKFKIIEN